MVQYCYPNQKVNKMETQKEWLTPKEVHLLYSFSTSSLAKWRMRNLNLEFSKIGKYIKYRRSDIEAFLEKNMVPVV